MLRVDNVERTITVRFKGAPSGKYVVLLFSSQKGRLDDDKLQIKTESYLTAISPTAGSALGGTLVTITGVNFSDNPLDNPVMIGDALCLVEKCKATTIICRIEKRASDASYPQEA